MLTPQGPVRFGANYTPSQGWFHSWLDLTGGSHDAADHVLDSVRRDLEDLAGIGLDHVRIFPLWPVIQPNRGLVRDTAVDAVLRVVDAAAEVGLDVAVDLLQGHLSSHDFLPSWITTWHRTSLFTDRSVRDGIADYAARLSAAVATRSNVFAITLGNEVNNLWPANPTTMRESDEWAAELIAVVRDAAPHVLALHSLYDDAWYSPGHPFSPTSAVDLGDATTVHSWVFNGVSAIDGPLGPATAGHAAYLVELADAMASDPARPVWLQEVGSPLPDVPVAHTEEFVRRTVQSAAHNPNLFGVTWWCSHDVDRSLLDYPEREYDLGLFTVDHVAKPGAVALAEVVREHRHGVARGVPTGGVASGAAWGPLRSAVVAPYDLRTEHHRRAEVAPGSAFHREWVAASASGAPVAIVLPQHVGDTERLTKRSVSTILSTSLSDLSGHQTVPADTLHGRVGGMAEDLRAVAGAAELERLVRHRSGLLDFASRAAHPAGGFAWLDDDGRPELERPVELWITCRMTHVAALALLEGRPDQLRVAEAMLDHGVAALTSVLRDADHGGWFAAVGPDGEPVDDSKQAYAHAFVILATASATAAKHPSGRKLLDEALDVFARRFWVEGDGLAVDQWDRTWSHLSTYRGVNANMHTVEAFLAAADVTGDPVWARRAARIVERVVHGFARDNGWRLPEHFTPGWQPMLDHNRDDPAHKFEPYGVTIGHLLEWSRLTLQVGEALGDEAPDWVEADATALFDRAVADGWDVDGAEGFVYTTDFEGRPVVRDRLHWVVAEAIAAAWALWRQTGDPAFLKRYEQWWDHADRLFVDAERGSWRHELDPSNRPSSRVWPGKPDVYHAYQAALLPKLDHTTSFAGGLTAAEVR